MNYKRLMKEYEDHLQEATYYVDPLDAIEIEKDAMIIFFRGEYDSVIHQLKALEDVDDCDELLDELSDIRDCLKLVYYYADCKTASKK